jgi:hypothetical protein
MKRGHEAGRASIGRRHVFVSFASNDAALAHRAVTALEESGLRCWFSDRDIEPATSYPAVITNAVKSSGAVLLLLTEASNQSPHVIREIELAFTARRPILPVRIGGGTPSPDLQYFLSRSQWLDAGASLDAAELARVQSRLTELLRGGAGGLVIDAPSVDGLPATGMPWAAAKSYCQAVGGRLPTEAEWEYAARAGTSTRYYDSLPATAWFSDNSDGGPHPVGGKTPNAYGLHDMLGNVSEWVLDRYYSAYDEASDPANVEEPLAGNASGVARGGSWVSDEEGVRVSRRLEMPPDAEEPHIGFRCVVDQL